MNTRATLDMVTHRTAVVYICRNGGRNGCLWWCWKYLLDRVICNVTFDSQLPNLRGQACESMGKSSRCMGHSAWMVNLEWREQGFNTQGCFYTHKSRGVSFLFAGGGNCAISLPHVPTGGNEHSAVWEKYISRVHQNWFHGFEPQMETEKWCLLPHSNMFN